MELYIFIVCIMNWWPFFSEVQLIFVLMPIWGVFIVLHNRFVFFILKNMHKNYSTFGSDFVCCQLFGLMISLGRVFGRFFFFFVFDWQSCIGLCLRDVPTSRCFYGACRGKEASTFYIRTCQSTKERDVAGADKRDKKNYAFAIVTREVDYW